ncbi:MAG: hypothetical protein AUJ12_08725 [Alphaproteobacteria bacterium CG1_02_46_17]|nr:MAG: hypothetical protein AUJ12_08725 [Alphaproteobacteria bacterium CG1_02_46_17]
MIAPMQLFLSHISIGTLWVLLLFFAGIYKAEAAPSSVDFVISMNEAVAVSGCPTTCPRITVDVGGLTHYASYSSGSGTNSLTFSYAPNVGDLDLDGVTLTSPIDLNGGSITDLNGNPISDLTFSVPDTSGIKVNYPSLSLDFLTNRYTHMGTAYTDLSSFFTPTSGIFTRNTVGTYFGQSGTLLTAPVDTPRFEYDPVTLQAKGLLIEETRTNKLFESTHFGSGNWTRSNTGVSLDVIAAPSGSMTADKLFILSGSSPSFILQDRSITSGITYTQSFFAKSAELSYAQIGASTGFDSVNTWVTFNLSTGTVSNQGSGGSYGIMDIGNGWYRIYLTATATSSSGAGRFYLAPSATNINRNPVQTGDNVSGIYIWGAQLEEGAFPTSFIPTFGSAQSRGSDNLTIPAGAWFNPAEGTLFARALNGQDIAVAGLAALTTDSANRVSLIRVSSLGIEHQVRDGDVTQALKTLNGSGNFSTNLACIAYEANNIIGSVNGLRTSLDNSATIPAIDKLVIGHWAGNGYLNGHVKNIAYYPQRAADSQVQLLTQ